MYIGDFLVGAIESTKSLIEYFIKLFNRGRFELQNWSFNDPKPYLM